MLNAIDLSQIRALTWDIGGTVFDWHHSIKDAVATRAAARGAELDAAVFANTWRRRMFEQLQRVRSGDLPWMNADRLHRMVLDELAGQYPSLGLSPADLDELNAVWHRLYVWPDAPAALRRLRERYTVVVLTVMSTSIAIDSSKHNGVDWDGILSCEFLGHYKPEPEAYLAGLKLLGVEPDQALMCAAHPADLRAAMAAGLRSAYVPRPGEHGETKDSELAAALQSAFALRPAESAGDSDRDLSQPDFDINAADFTDLADQLLV